MSHRPHQNAGLPPTRGRGWKWLIAAAALSALAACGGGSSPPVAANTAPTNVSLTEVISASVGAMSVSWLPASDDATPAASIKYQVHASTDAGFTPRADTLKFEGTGVTSASITSGLTPGSIYAVRLLAIDGSGAATTSDALQVAVTNVRLPDTGITASQCYAAGSNVPVSCTSDAAIALNDQQDGMVGRDVTTPDNSDGKLGFSYSAVSGGCVKDNITGLTWEVKTVDGGLRDMNKAYTNYDDATKAQKWTGSAFVNPTQTEIDAATNTLGYAAAVNATSLCSYTDWRLPTADELQGIVDYGVAYPGPTIDGLWFPNTVGTSYWSSSPYAGDAGNAWYVNFGDGVVGNYNRYNGYAVRLVR